MQISFERERRQCLVGRFLGEHEFLPRGQPDDPRHIQFQLGEIVAGDDELLLAGLQFDLRAQRIDGRTQSGFQLVGGLVVKSLRALDLGFGGFHASAGGNGLQIGVADREHDHFARIFVS